MRAYLELLRLPTVFTAMADIVLGYLLTHGSFEQPGGFFTLLASSCCLYLAGMVMNDVFDVAQDTRERPSRPIPSGRISRPHATLLGLILIVAGLALSALASMTSLLIAFCLSAAVLSYDGFLKATWLGPLNMGLCRSLNLLLGASLIPWEDASQLLSPPVIIVSGGLGLYITGVTLFARTEARQSATLGLLGGLLVIDAGIGVLMWLTWTTQRLVATEAVLMLLFLIAISLNSRAFGALSDPQPSRVQGMIKLFLLNYVTLCAALVYWQTGNSYYALGTACLVIPALFLGRLIAMT